MVLFLPNFIGYKGIRGFGRKGQGKWGLPISGEGFKGGVCERLHISLSTSWCNL